MRERKGRPPQTLECRLERTGTRWAQLRAQKLFQEMRARSKAKEQQRRQAVRRAIEAGSVVLAVANDWSPAELTGALLDAQERMNRSATFRMATRKRGEKHLGVVVDVDDPEASPTATESLQIDSV